MSISTDSAIDEDITTDQAEVIDAEVGRHIEFGQKQKAMEERVDQLEERHDKEKSKVSSRKFVVLLILLIVHMTVTVALFIGFIGADIAKMDQREKSITAIGTKLEKQTGDVSFANELHDNQNALGANFSAIGRKLEKQIDDGRKSLFLNLKYKFCQFSYYFSSFEFINPFKFVTDYLFVLFSNELRNNQHTLGANVSAIMVKLEKQIGNISNELRHNQNVMAANVSAIGTKFEEAGKRIRQLFRTDQASNNNWNRADCHSDLVINETRKSVQRKESYSNGWRSCRAKLMVPHHFGFFYYEVEIVHKSAAIGIGLAPKALPLYEWVWTEDSGAYAYQSDGHFGGHHSAEYEKPPPFGVGDTVGVGINLATRQSIYTRNGQRLDTANLYVGTAGLYPAVSLLASPDSVVANFGPNFRYNLSQEFENGIEA